MSGKPGPGGYSGHPESKPPITRPHCCLEERQPAEARLPSVLGEASDPGGYVPCANF